MNQSLISVEGGRLCCLVGFELACSGVESIMVAHAGFRAQLALHCRVKLLRIFSKKIKPPHFDKLKLLVYRTLLGHFPVILLDPYES